MKTLFCLLLGLLLFGCELGLSNAVDDMIVVVKAIDPALEELQDVIELIEDEMSF